MRLTEHARAKVNLTLTVHGRRVDGFHELSSVVAFADDAADRLEMDFTRPPGLSVSGPFAQHLVGDANLILDALSATTRAIPGLAVGFVTLHKALPVAAGIGGGSADAAATLRLIQRGNPDAAVEPAVWSRIAASLGSDVPVCLENQMSTMSGRGEAVVPLSAPPLAAVLVNPMAPVPSNKTAAVFKALAAPPLGAQPQAWRPPWTPSTPLDTLHQQLARHPNDLQAAATQVMPVISEVLAALQACPAVGLVRLSGAGPTCFGLFAAWSDAEVAAARLAAAHPAWWAKASMLS